MNKSTYDNPWMMEDKPLEIEDVENHVGMVYLIVNNLNGRKYVGKKFFWKTVKRPPLKGKKRRRHVRMPSDWKTYYGSNKELNDYIDEHGLDNIERYVLRLCDSKSECSYYELKEQVDREVLFDDSYYNEFIGVKINAKHLKEKQCYVQE